MISTSSLVFDEHHGHGLGPGPGSGPGSLHHMTFVDPYVRSKLPNSVPDFIGSFAKPAPLVPRFNGQRPSPSQSPRKDYPIVPVSSTSGPMNLTSVKLESGNLPDNHISTSSVNIQVPHLTTGYTSRMYPPSGFPYASLQNPYGSLYPSLLSRPTYINASSLSPLDNQFSPPQKPNGGSCSPDVFHNAPNGASHSSTPFTTQSAPLPPPPPSKISQPFLREKRTFKVPSIKESNGRQKLLNTGKSTTKRVSLTSNVNNNNNLLPPNFTKGSLIQLANGDLRRVEDVTTEELVSSAEKCPAFRLDPSTVVRIIENNHGTVLLTLSYGENKKTIDMESTLEYPYFVYGQGWTSCSPERTMNCYGLHCSRLKVGDICLSLSPRQTQDTNVSRNVSNSNKNVN